MTKVHRSLSPMHMRWLLLFAGIVLTLAVISRNIAGLDHRPLQWALRTELHGQSAYSPQLGKELYTYYYAHDCLPCAQGGFAYPLPAIWLALPIVELPDEAAGTVWFILAAGSVIVGLLLLRLPLFLLLYLPFIAGIRTYQVTVLLTGLLLIGLWAIREERRWILACVIAVTIAAKPQASFLIASGLLYHALRLRSYRQLAVCLSVIIGVTCYTDIAWPLHWLGAIQTFSNAVGTIWFAYWLPVAILCFLGGQRWVALSIAQVCLFPISWLYALLPLVVGYVEVASRRRILVGVLCSWLAIIPIQLDWALPETAYSLLLIAPLVWFASAKMLRSFTVSRSGAAIDERERPLVA